MISVIVPIYNVEDYIEECLLSIIRQTYTDLEIICVDDCSMDNSTTVVRKYMAADPRIRLINHHENKGLGGARNTGIREANGEYIMFIDSDDVIDPTMMEKMEKAMRRYPVDAVVCGICRFTGNQELERSSTFHTLQPGCSRIIQIGQHKERLTNMWPSAPNKIYRTSIIRKYQCEFPEHFLYEDHFFYYNYFSLISAFYYIDEALYRYRASREGSITSTSTGREKEVFTVLDSLEKLFSKTMDEETSKHCFEKIAFRLTWERHFVLWNNLPQWLAYVQKAEEWLFARFTYDELKNAVDSKVDHMDPFYRYIFSTGKTKKLFQIKLALKQRPGIVRLYGKFWKIKHYRTRRSMIKEMFWLEWEQYKKLNELSYPVWHGHDLLDQQFKDDKKKNIK